MDQCIRPSESHTLNFIILYVHKFGDFKCQQKWQLLPGAFLKPISQKKNGIHKAII